MLSTSAEVSVDIKPGCVPWADTASPTIDLLGSLVCNSGGPSTGPAIVGTHRIHNFSLPCPGTVIGRGGGNSDGVLDTVVTSRSAMPTLTRLMAVLSACPIITGP